jgi:hypothetical protein
MNKLIRSIASELVGMAKDDLSTAEKNIVEALIEARIVKYDKHGEVAWEHTEK